MVNGTTAIIGTVPTFQAIALAGENIKFFKNKKKGKNMMGIGVKNIVGIELIRKTGSLASLV